MAVEWVGTAEICARLGVDPETVRGWRRRGLVRPLLDTAGRPVRVAAAGMVGRGEYLHPWEQAVEAERVTRAGGMGRPRKQSQVSPTSMGVARHDGVYR